MNLLSTISEYKRLDKLLADEIMGEQREQKVLLFDKAMRELSDNLAQEKPHSRQDTMAQITFFLDMASNMYGSSTAMDTAKKIIAERLEPSPIIQTCQRISHIGTDFHYHLTTNDNSEFYGIDQSRVVGRHVAEIIGENRFHGRAKTFLENCFSGQRQEYFHELEIDAEQRIMQCVMEPIFDGQKGALVSMFDVTNNISSNLVEIEAA